MVLCCNLEVRGIKDSTQIYRFSGPGRVVTRARALEYPRRMKISMYRFNPIGISVSCKSARADRYSCNPRVKRHKG